MSVVCPHCQTNIKIQVDLSLRLEAKAAVPETVSDRALPPKGIDFKGAEQTEEVAPAPAFQLDSKKVAIAIHGEGTREIIKELLEDAQFEVSEVASLYALFPVLRAFCPATVLVDVSLPNAAETHLSEEIAKELSPNKANLLLVSSGYGWGQPSPEAQIAFAGADGYIERGNIQRDLIDTIKVCLGSEISSMPKTVAPQPVEQALSEESQDTPSTEAADPFFLSPPMHVEAREGERPLQGEHPLREEAASLPAEIDQKESEAAKRLARIIVSDIILYNEKKVEEGFLNGTFFDLLREEIDEGRKHYNSRVSIDIQKHRDYLGDVFKDFLRKRRAALV